MKNAYLLSTAMFIMHIILFLSKDAIHACFENEKIYITSLEESLNNLTL